MFVFGRTSHFFFLRQLPISYLHDVTDRFAFFQFSLHYLAPVGAMMFLGLLGGKAANRLRLPKVTGYLLTGIIIGPSVFGLISRDIVNDLTLVNDIALGLILFSLGSVFEIHHIQRFGRKLLLITAFQTFAVVVFTTLLVHVTGVDLYPSILLGTIAIATAPAAIVLVVREYEAQGEFTDTLISVMAISNIICILLFELAYGIGHIQHGRSLLYAVADPLYEMGGGLIVGGTVGFILSKWEQRIEDFAELLMIILAGILLVTGLSWSLGLQPLLANLVMGAVTTNLSMMHRLVYVEYRQIEQPLYIAFFVLAGASLHLKLLPGLGLAGIAYLTARVVGKIIGAYGVGSRVGITENDRKYLGIGMLAQAGVAIGLVDTVSRSDPQVGDIVEPIILATVLIYETIGPPVLRYVLFKVGEVASQK